ncbi:hypothetical protein KEM60_02496 [Austwickia sp. TVS 96-490-7B]|nr:hypothetical protein [Austwickia sp. TVS 96-490-7B]
MGLSWLNSLHVTWAAPRLGPGPVVVTVMAGSVAHPRDRA